MAKVPDEPIMADNFRQQLLGETKLVKDCCEKSAGTMAELLQSMMGIKEEISKFLDEIKGLNKKSEKSGKSDKESNKDRDRDYRLQGLLLRTNRRSLHQLNNINQAIGSGPIPRGAPTPTVSAENFERMLSGTNPAGGGGGTGDGGDGGREGRGRGDGDDNFAGRLARRVASISSEILGGWSLQDLFAGSIKDVTEYRSNMRMLAYELEGVTEDTRGLQSNFASLGDDVVKITGHSLDETQKAYATIIKKGVKDRKEALKVVKTGLHASYMLGADAQQTAEVFGDWHRTLDMSSGQMDQLARDSKDIARATGMTGDELLGVMKKSESILRNLRNQGNLTNSSAKNVIRAMAEAEKLGIGDLSSTILTALSDSNKFFHETDEKTKRFLVTMGARMGKLGEMQAGTFTNNRKNMALMAGEMKNVLAQLTMGRATNFKDIEKLSANERMVLQQQLQAMFGMTIGEFQKFGEAQEKAGKSLGQTFADLQKEMTDGNITAEEKLKLEKQMNDLIKGTGLKAMGDYSEELRKKSTAEAANEIFNNEKYSELAQDINDTLMKEGIDPAKLSAEQKMQEVSLIGARKLQDQAKKEGIKTIKYEGNEFDVSTLESELKSAMAAGDEVRIRELNSIMAQANQEVETKEKGGIDPLTEANQLLKQTNEYLRTLVGGYIGQLIDAIGSLGLILLGFAGSIAGLATYFPALIGSLGMFGGLFRGITGVFGRLFGGRGVGGRAGGGRGPFGFLGGLLKGIGDNLKGIAGLGLLSAALLVAGVAMTKFSEVKWEDVGKGIVTLAALTAAAYAISKIQRSIIMGAAGIMVISGALCFAAVCFKSFAEVDWSSIMKGTIALAAVSLAGVLAGKFAKDIILGAVGILVLSGALWVLGKALQQFSSVGWETLGLAAVALVGFAIAAGIMGIPPIFAAILAGAVAIGALGVAIGLFGLGLMPVAHSMKIFSEAFGIFIDQIMKLVEVDSMNLLMIGPALASIGIGASIFAAGMSLATAGGVITGLASLFGVKSPLERIKEFVPIADQIATIGKGFKDFGDGILGIANGLKELDGESLAALKNKISEFLEIGSSDKMKLMAEYLSKIAESLDKINKSTGISIETESLEKINKPTGISKMETESLEKINKPTGISKMETESLEKINKPTGISKIETESLEKINKPTGISKIEMAEKVAIESSVSTAIDKVNASMKSGLANESLLSEPSAALVTSKEEVDVTPTAQPKLDGDIVTSILREKTSAEAGTSTIKSDELSSIESASQEQNDHLIKVTDKLEKIAQLLTPGGTVGDSSQMSGNTVDKRVPAGAINMGCLKYGKPGDSANRDVVPTQ
jgi:hypothetical protein